MKPLATKIAELEARFAARAPKAVVHDAAAAERLRRHFESLPMQRDREAQAKACMTPEQELDSVEREMAAADDEIRAAEREATAAGWVGAGDVRVRLARVGRRILRFQQAALLSQLEDTRRGPNAPARPALSDGGSTA